MTYIVDISLSLIRVLEAAAFFRDERIAGFAANADFWAAEVRHVLDVLAGHDKRFTAWRAAAPNCSATGPVSADDLSRLSKRIQAGATRFFRLCRPHLQRAQILEIEQLLGIDIDHVCQETRD